MKGFELGVDMTVHDDILSGITFEELIVTLQCNCQEITPESIRETYLSIANIRLTDARAVLDRNIHNIMEAAKGCD